MKKLLITALLGCAAMPSQAFTYVTYEAWGEGSLAYTQVNDPKQYSLPASVYATATFGIDTFFQCSSQGISCSWGGKTVSFSTAIPSNSFSLTFDHTLTGWPTSADGFVQGYAQGGAFVSGVPGANAFGGGSLTRFKVTTFQSDNQLFPEMSVSVSGGVPEPATWAMMIAGFGLAGVALRMRRISTQIA